MSDGVLFRTSSRRRGISFFLQQKGSKNTAAPKENLMKSLLLTNVVHIIVMYRIRFGKNRLCL